MSNDAPKGYAVPKIVTDLMAYAEAHGWRSAVAWGHDSGNDPLMAVEVGRKLTDEEAKAHRSNLFHYRLTWHSRDCEPGKLRKFRAGLAKTPDHPQWCDAPSVRKIREVIYANPTPDAVTVHKGPISRAEFNAIPGARVLRFSYDWMNLRYVEWIEDAPGWGWTLMNNYGNPDDHCVVSRADSRAMAADHLTAFLAPNRSYGGDNLTVDEWEIAP